LLSRQFGIGARREGVETKDVVESSSKYLGAVEGIAGWNGRILKLCEIIGIPREDVKSQILADSFREHKPRFRTTRQLDRTISNASAREMDQTVHQSNDLENCERIRHAPLVLLT